LAALSELASLFYLLQLLIVGFLLLNVLLNVQWLTTLLIEEFVGDGSLPRLLLLLVLLLEL
jgi:hypothetical protein